MSANFSSLPPVFRKDKFTKLRRGIFDDPETTVYVNEDRTFAFLDPLPEIDYSAYEPRVGRLGKRAYKNRLNLMHRRFEKVVPFFEGVGALLEIGAGDGEFLELIHQKKPDIRLHAFEPDQMTKSRRDEFDWLTEISSFDSCVSMDFDFICFFHVLEHILDPVEFLISCGASMKPSGCLCIEVPALSDPIFDLYKIPAYEEFFFQRQHPFYYSAQSLQRLLVSVGFEIEEMIPYQRYGIENHLQWLTAQKPGGNETFRDVFADSDGQYRRDLEISWHCDTVIAIAKHDPTKHIAGKC